VHILLPSCFKAAEFASRKQSSIWMIYRMKHQGFVSREMITISKYHIHHCLPALIDHIQQESDKFHAYKLHYILVPTQTIPPCHPPPSCPAPFMLHLPNQPKKSIIYVLYVVVVVVGMYARKSCRMLINAGPKPALYPSIHSIRNPNKNFKSKLRYVIWQKRACCVPPLLPQHSTSPTQLTPQPPSYS
jgi:hypothetical protein